MVILEVLILSHKRNQSEIKYLKSIDIKDGSYLRKLTFASFQEQRLIITSLLIFIVPSSLFSQQLTISVLLILRTDFSSIPRYKKKKTVSSFLLIDALLYHT